MPDNPYSVVGFIVMHEHHVEGQLFTLYSSFEWIDERHIARRLSTIKIQTTKAPFIRKYKRHFSHIHTCTCIPVTKEKKIS